MVTDFSAEDILAFRRVPAAVLPYPIGFWDKCKYTFWHSLAPTVLGGRDLLIRAGIIKHHGRQRYLFGTLKSLESVHAFIAYLQAQGFGNHFIAWRDRGQLISLRKLDSFERQYHVRIFADGEVRGHYEYTPESHPLWHFDETGIQERRAEFMNFFGRWIVKSL